MQRRSPDAVACNLKEESECPSESSIPSLKKDSACTPPSWPASVEQGVTAPPPRSYTGIGGEVEEPTYLAEMLIIGHEDTTCSETRYDVWLQELWDGERTAKNRSDGLSAIVDTDPTSARM